MWSRGVASLSRAVVRRGTVTVASVRVPAAARPLSSNSNSPVSLLDAFRDPVDRQVRGDEPVGRSWSATELRRKSYEDLHKLWYVLYREKNMLLTEQQLSRRRTLVFPQPARMKKVQKSMGAIKQVLGERKRKKIAAHLSSKMEEAMQAESSIEEEMEVDLVGTKAAESKPTEVDLGEAAESKQTEDDIVGAAESKKK
jgi:large subunit ribosomal protein L47